MLFLIIILLYFLMIVVRYFYYTATSPPASYSWALEQRNGRARKHNQVRTLIISSTFRRGKAFAQSNRRCV